METEGHTRRDDKAHQVVLTVARFAALLLGETKAGPPPAGFLENCVTALVHWVPQNASAWFGGVVGQLREIEARELGHQQGEAVGEHPFFIWSEALARSVSGGGVVMSPDALTNEIVAVLDAVRTGRSRTRTPCVAEANFLRAKLKLLCDAFSADTNVAPAGPKSAVAVPRRLGELLREAAFLSEALGPEFAAALECLHTEASRRISSIVGAPPYERTATASALRRLLMRAGNGFIVVPDSGMQLVEDLVALLADFRVPHPHGRWTREATIAALRGQLAEAEEALKTNRELDGVSRFLALVSARGRGAEDVNLAKNEHEALAASIKDLQYHNGFHMESFGFHRPEYKLVLPALRKLGRPGTMFHKLFDSKFKEVKDRGTVALRELVSAVFVGGNPGRISLDVDLS